MVRRVGVALCVVLLLSGCSGGDDDATPDPGAEPGAAEEDAPDDEVFAAPEGESAQNPAFSPDGEQILVTIFHEGYNDGPAGLFVMPVDGGEPEPLLDPEDNDAVNMPGTSWHEDQIVFSSDREGGGAIWTIPTEGGESELIVEMAGRYLQEPTFSPDGGSIVFEALDEEADAGTIWRVPATGGEPVALTTDADGDCRQPNWSPVEDQIVMQCRPSGSGLYQLVIIRGDGSNRRDLTELEDDGTDASWSPDGGSLVYSAAVEDGAGLFVIDAEGGEPERLDDDDSGYDGAPSWSPDGTRVFFESSQTPEEPTVIRFVGVE